MDQKTLDAIRKIEEYKPKPEQRDASDLEIGEVAHQGDIYIHRVPDDWPRGRELVGRQLQVGMTVGARHIAAGGDEVKLFKGVRYPPGFREDLIMGSQVLLGPVVVSPSKVTHPEHADHELGGGTKTYQITYQLDMLTQSYVFD